MKHAAELKPRDELAGTHMWGQMVEIANIRKAEKWPFTSFLFF
ncbi:MAG: hypothetical protein PVH45_01240 [Candidatus Omnitrophota bacterium]